MAKLPAVIQTISLFLGTIFAIYVCVVAVENYQYKEMQGIGRGLIASALLIYTIWHAYVLRKHGSFIHNLILYPIIYVMFGIVSEYSWLGFTKNWAPATQSEATIENIKWLIIILTVVAAGVASLLYKPKP